MITYDDIFNEITERVANNELDVSEASEILEAFEEDDVFTDEDSEDATFEAYNDVIDSLASVDAFLEEAAGCDTCDKTKADEVEQNGKTSKNVLQKVKEKIAKKKKSTDSKDMGKNVETTTNVVKEAVQERRLRAYEAYANDMITKEDLDNCLTLLDVDNYPELS